MKALLGALCALTVVQAMPMTSHSVNARCRDKLNRFYPVGYHFTREDGYKCNCSYIPETRSTRLYCHSPLYTHRGSASTSHGSAYETSHRLTAADRCEYQNRHFALNTRWKMRVDGVLMDCHCNASAHLSCKSGHITSTSRSTNLHLGYNAVAGEADTKCQQDLFQENEYFAIRQAGGFYSLCTCHGVTATCSVPTASGEECMFPFDLGGQLYSTCTAQGNPRRKPFCVTSRSGVSPQVVADCISTIEELNQYYGYVFTQGGNSNGARCHFPFSIGGVQHHTCQTDENGLKWCATTANYDIDQRYGFCMGERASDAVYNALGETANLQCRYNPTERSTPPTIKWYKLHGNTRQHIYTYDTATNTGGPAPTAGFYASRISMPNANTLQIENMQYGDTGTFECEVSYPGVTTTSQRTDVSVSSSPSNLYLTYVPRIGQVTFKWTNPRAQIDQLRLEFQQQGSNAVAQVRMSPNRESHTIYRRFTPGETYAARLYAVTNGKDSIPAQKTFTLPRFPVRTIPGSSGQTTPSAAQPLATPRVQDHAIILNWYPAPLPDVQVTGWHVVYEDSTTREISNVTLAPGTTSFTIEDLTPGTVYRVTLYAIVDGNQVEIARTDATTEPTPAELSGPVQRGDVTESSVVLSWPSPTQHVTHYEISYRDVSSPGSAWQKYTIGASNNPRIVQSYLTPGTTYDFHITPITNNVRGVYSPVTVTTPSRPASSSQLDAPTNLQLTDVTRSSFTARWEPGEGPDVNYYNISITPALSRQGDRPYRTIVTHPIFYAGSLEGGRTYIFRVVAVSGLTVSPAASDTITTVNEVCEVEGIWRAADEKFFKRHPRGYMQNCTCSRKVGGGRWRCEPIICEVDGYQRTVDETWQRPAADGVSVDECTCQLSRQISCVPTDDQLPEPQRGPVRSSVGGRLELHCPHETSSATRPTVEWSKVENGAERLLYVYHGAQAYGHQERTAGDMSGRISMDNEVDFIIEPVHVSDTGTYECRVIYPGVAPSVHLSTISVTPAITDRTDTSLLYIPATPTVHQTNPNYITITWDRSPQEATSYIIKYTDITNNGMVHSFSVREPSAQISGLLPSTRYRIEVIPVLNGAQGEAMDFEVTTSPEDVPVVTEALRPVAPKPPTNLRFDSKGRTSITARWTPPFDLIPPDNYRVEYKLSDSTDQPQSVETLQRYLRVNNLQPGQLYEFKVYAVRDRLDSLPNTREVETSPVGRILVQASNTRRSNTVGSTANLYCRYDKSTPGEPLVTWVKLGGVEPELIFTHDTSTGRKTIESSEFTGRLTSSDSSRLDISNLKGSDDGYYECRVTYPTGGGKGRTAIIMTGIPEPVTFTSPIQSPDEDIHTLVWEVASKPQPETFLLNVRKRGSSRQTYSTFNVPGGARSFRFRNLKPGKTYEGYMVTQNSYGSSPRTNFYFTTDSSDRPNPPTKLELSNPSSNRVTVIVFGPADVDYYRIRYSPETPIQGVPEKTAQGTSPTDRITLTEMVPNTPYVISVTSVLDNVESVPLRAKLTTPQKRPPTPSDLTVIEMLPRSITFEIVGDRTDVDQYEIAYRPTIGGTENIYRAGPDEDRITLTLEPDLQYQVVVKALSEDGGISGAMRTVLTTPPEETPPDRPQRFTLIDASTDSVTLRWTGSTDGVQYYRVTYRQSNDTVAALRQTPGIQQAMVIPNLIPDSDYFVSVTAVGQGGHSPKLEGRFRTLPELTFGTSDVTQIGVLPEEATIFLNPDVDVDYYIVRYRPEGETEEQETIVLGPNITLHHLAPTTRYLVTLIAVKDNVESTPVQTTIITQPGEVVVVPEDRSSFTEDNIISVGTLPDEVTFYLIPDDSVDYYLVNYRLEGQDESQNTEEVLSGPNITLHHLLPSSRYIVTLVVVKDNVDSSPVVTVVETPQDASTAGPSQPTGLRQLGTSPTVVNFLIEGPTTNVEYYRVDWMPVDGSGTTQSRNNPNNDLTLVGLTPATRYTVRVKAVYNGFESQPITAYFVTDAVVTEEVPLVGSITPTNLRVTRVGPDTATLEWTQPGSSDNVARYTFDYRETLRDYLPFTRKHVAATSPYISLFNLVPNADYTVQLTTIGRNRQRPIVTTTFRTMPEDLVPESTVRPTVVVRTSPFLPEPIPTDEPEPLPQPLEGPRGLTVERRSDKDADIVWELIGDRDEIDGYLVEYEPTFTRHGPSQSVILPNTATKANLPNLTPGTEYQVRVFTTRGDQQSAPTLATFISKIYSPNHVVGIPGHDRVTVTWKNPKGHFIGTRFETRKPGQSWRARVFNTDVTSHAVPISPDDEQLEIRVTAIGQTIESLPTETLVIIKAPDDDIFGEPVVIDDVTDYEAVVTVDRDVVPSDGWTLRLEDEDGIVGSPLNFTSSATTTNVADLQPGKKYRVVILSPRGDEIGVTEFTTKADRPKNIHTVETAPASGTISWEKPHSDITGYVVKYRPVGEGGEWTSVDLTPNATEHKITRLVPETLYEVDVTPTYDDTVNNDTHTLGMSAVHRFTTTSEEPEPTPPSTPPRPATNIRFPHVEPNRVTANWSPSPDTDIDTHRVVLSRADDGSLVVSSNLPTSYAVFTRLEPDTLYEVVVTATKGVQESTPLAGNVYTGKNAPSSVTVSDVTPYGVTVTWEPEMPENPLVVGYIVTVRERDSTLPAQNYTFPANVHEANLTDLAPGTPYEITVTSIIDDVTTQPVTTTTTTLVPNPTGISFSDVTENSITVSWNKPSDSIDDYVVDYWPTGNPDSRRIRVQDQTQATINNLTPESSYTVSVHSVYNGRMSNGVIRKKSTNSRIGPPQNVDIDELTDTSAVIFWEPFNNEFRHRVVLSSQLSPSNSSTTYLEPGVNRSELTDLQPGTSYSVVVGSVPTAGNHMRQSLPLFFTTRPSRPTNLHATQTTPQHIIMEWDHERVSQFYVTYQPETGGDIEDLRTRTNRAFLPNLQPVTLYVVTVQAIVPDEVFSEAAVKSVWTDEAPPASLPENINVDHTPQSGTNTYIVTWTLPEGSDASYEIYFYPVDDEDNTNYFITPPGSTSHTLSGLRPGTEYNVKIHPADSTDVTNYVERTFFTVLPRPTRVEVSDLTETGFVVEWDADDLDDVTYYTVKVFPMGHPNSAITERVSSFAPHAHPFTGLEPGRNYQIDVTAHTDVTASAPTTTYVTTTIDGPSNVNAEVLHDRVVVTWDGPDDVDRYRVTVRPSSDVSSSHNPVFTTAPVTRYTFTDLQPNTEYLVDVVAMNLYRQLESRPAQGSFVTLAATTPAPATTAPFTEPAAQPVRPSVRPVQPIRPSTRPVQPIRPIATTERTPEPLESNPVDEGSYNIRWNAPTENVRFYKVIRVSGTGQRKQIVVPSYRTDVLLNNLSPDTEYSVTVYAVLTDDSEVPLGSTQLEIPAFSTDRSATITWNQQTPSYESFRITATPVAKNSPAEESVFTDIESGNTHAWLTGLHPGTKYNVLVEGLLNGIYYPVDETTVTTAVDPPRNLRVSKRKPTGFTLRWDPPVAKIRRYSLTYQLDGRGPEMAYDQTPGAKATRSHVRNLRPGSRYLIRLYARSVDGDSPPAQIWVETLQAPTDSGITSEESEETDNGVLVRWKSTGRFVQNWKVVVEPQDGSAGYERIVSRDDRRFELDNLLHGVAYIVKIYPIFGDSVVGDPRIINIPASSTQGSRTTIVGTNRVNVNTFPWQLRVPRVRPDGVTLMWNQPWFSVQEYVLYIKKQSEPDSAYREVSPQPLPGQNMATISNLVPGEHYTIQLNATSADSHGHQSIVSTITINFSTLLPAISGVQIRSQDDGSILLTWDATQGIDNYVVKYRENRAEFTTRIISATETSYVIPSPTPGTQYEIHFYAEKGSAHSHTLVFTIDVPAALAPNCQDLDTGINYDVGASWNKNTGGYKLRCTCSAPQQYTCDTAEWCHADNEVYDPGETWTRVRGINLRESCTCRGRGGYQCEPTNCHDQGRGYDEGQTWTTAVGNIVSECVCRCAINSFGHSRCQSTCQQPFAVLNERAKRETDEPEVNE